MIIKTKSRKSGAKGIIRYLFKDEKKLTEGKEKPLVIKHNVRGRKEESWVKEFKENEDLRLVKRKDSVGVYHTIVSFSGKDRKHITEKLLKDIAREYIKNRGDDMLYLGTVHRDKEHIHLHLVESGTKYKTGVSARLSKSQFSELKRSMDVYQKEKYPELIHSLPEHGRKKSREVKEKEETILKRDSRAIRKESILETLQSAYSKANSEEAFLEALKDTGYAPYARGGKVTGITDEAGQKYRFSTLGFDREQLQKLEERENEEKELDEIRSIRSQAEEREEELERDYDWTSASLTDTDEASEESEDDE